MEIYLDDCFIILDTNQYSTDDLQKLLNSLHKNLKFTMETHDKEIPFLDVLIKKDSTK